MTAIYKKDVRSAFSGMTGWVLCAFVVLVMGLYFTAINLSGGYADYSYTLGNMLFVFLVVVPLLTMRGVEERRQKTDQLLLTSPVSISGIVWGKYLALLTVYAVPLVLMAFCPLVLSQYGDAPLARSYVSLGAFFLVGAAAIAIGMFIATLTESQLIAGVCTFGALLLLYLMPSIASLVSSAAGASVAAFTALLIVCAVVLYLLTRSVLVPTAVFLVTEAALVTIYFVKSEWLEGAFPKVLNAIALFGRFDTFTNGVFDWSAILYFVSVALLFVLFTCQSYEKRRWN